MDWTLPDLREAWERVRRKGAAGGFDGRELEDFQTDLESHLTGLLEDLNHRHYLPDPALRVRIPKGEGRTRPLGLLTIRDKVAQVAVKPRLEQVLEKVFHPASYAYRPDKGHRKALARVEHELQRGLTWIAAADIKDFFDSLDHGRLLAEVDRHFPDPWLRELLRMWLWIGVVDRAQVAETPAGVQQGGVVSPLLANLYLNEFDHRLEQAGLTHVRYADDFILLCATRPRAEEALRQAERWLREDYRLALNESKRELAPLAAGFTFLGVYFQGRRRRIDQKKVSKAVGSIYGFRQGAHRLEDLLGRARASFRSWHQHYAFLEPAGVFFIYDRVLGNEIGAFLQAQYRRDPARRKKDDRAILERIPWLLYHTRREQREDWARRILAFPLEKLADPAYRHLPFPRGERPEEESGEARGPAAPLRPPAPWRQELEAATQAAVEATPDAAHAREPAQAAAPADPDVQSGAPSVAAVQAEATGAEAGPSSPATLGPSKAVPPAPSNAAASPGDRRLKARLSRRRRKVERLFLGRQTLVVSRSGACLRRQGERLVVTVGEEKLGQWPLRDLQHVWLLTRNVTVTGHALQACLEAKLPLEVCGPHGQVIGRLSGPELPAMRCGAAQELLRDKAGGLAVAREMVLGKVGNQRKLLQYFRKSRRRQCLFNAAWKEQHRVLDRALARLEEMDPQRTTLDAAAFREQLRAQEAQAAKAYWSIVRWVLPQDLDFPGRKRHGARDLVNSALNYGYGVLYNHVWRAVLEAGLNPCVGFMHEDQRGKPTLSFDLIEEFRAPMVDRVVFSLFSKEEPLRLEDGLLCHASRRLIVTNLLERWQAPARYRSAQELLGEIPALQAKHLARVVLGEESAYRSWSFQW
ncbi:MAG: CRISPR-associated endonuclease Cas1 [bacterium]|nr:CRISPR-associated endonuclease Cas1 [bacterium]